MKLIVQGWCIESSRTLVASFPAEVQYPTCTAHICLVRYTLASDKMCKMFDYWLDSYKRTTIHGVFPDSGAQHNIYVAVNVVERNTPARHLHNSVVQ